MKIYRVAYMENDTLSEKPVRLMREWRTYKCDVCGFLQAEPTNHHGKISSVCNRCSWSPSYGAGHSIPQLGGKTYRVFSWVSDDVDWDALPKQSKELPKKP